MTSAVYNPHAKPVSELPIIYGFNNGGSPGFFYGALIAQDGTGLGGHLCSHEHYMPGDLGVLEGRRPDRHEGFRAHYPDGYRMEFVGYEQFDSCDGLKAACALASAIDARSGETAQQAQPKGQVSGAQSADAQPTAQPSSPQTKERDCDR